MSTIQISANAVRITFSRAEKLFSLSSDLDIPVERITAVRSVGSAYDEVHGWRAPGTAIPGLCLAGTFHPGNGEKTFALVHGRGEGIVLETAAVADDDTRRFVLTCEDAPGVAERIEAVLPSRQS